MPAPADRYELCDQLGKGGTSTVWLGRRLGDKAGPEALVAIKSLLPGQDVHGDAERAFLYEARISQCVRHPNVVPTLDVAMVGDERVMVMPYVHGVTLAALLRSCIRNETTCPVDVAGRIVHDLLLGLDAAHRATTPEGTPLGLVHRDVSPQNVLVDASGVARLIDFGIAKTVDSDEHTPRGEMKGKAPYLAPEVLDGERATARTDVYSAAVVLWETLCARRLFSGRTAVDILVAILTNPIARPSEVLGVPVALDDVVMRGLSRSPNARPPTASDFAYEIARSMPLASRESVAAWVRANAGEELARRELLGFYVAPRPAVPVEPRTVIMPRPAPPTTVPPPPAVGRGALVLLGLLVVASLLATLAASVHAFACATRAPGGSRVTTWVRPASNGG